MADSPCVSLSAVQSKFLTVALWIIVAFCVIRVIRKLLKCRLLHLIHFNYRHIGSYIDDVDLATLVKIPLIVCTLIFISGVWIHGNRCLCPLEWQWQVGIAAVFLAWADLVLYMRKLRLLGTLADFLFLVWDVYTVYLYIAS